MADWGKILSRGNVEDRRGGGALMGGGLGIVGVAVVLLFNIISGNPIDLTSLLGQIESSSTESSLTNQDFAGADDYETFTSTVLGSNNQFWQDVFARNNRSYSEPRLVLFRTATTSGCGIASSDVGPHYCPADQTIYIDETFFAELQQRFKAQGGDVAEAYVISHEVGHHVQHLLSTLDQASQEGNQASIAIELQADCYAGSWANSIAHLNVFEPNEINEAIDAAAAVGDDRIQQSVSGQISPETWTHGSSEQRVHWFTTGFNSGDPATCTTI